MQEVTVALKYARAVFDSARESGDLDSVQADLEGVLALVKSDPSVMDFLVSPEMLTEDKLEFVKTVFEPRTVPLVGHLMRLLVEKARIQLLPEICKDFQLLVEEDRGLLRAQVLSAVPISSEQEQKLKSELDRITGKNVMLDNKVDPSVLGGMVIHLGNQIIDRSLSHGLNRMRDSLMQAEVN